MQRIALLFMMLAIVASLDFGIGAPKSVFGGRSYNSFSLCCADGFVQDALQGFHCVPCQSVGLIQCAVCTLYYERSDPNDKTAHWNEYRCLSSKNINNLITVGSTSQCTNPQGLADNTYVLNNFSNFDSCVSCSSIIKHSQTCKITYDCELSLASNTGNNCVPSIKVIKCADGFIISDDKKSCQVCSQLFYGCTECILNNGNAMCDACDASLNLTRYGSETHCSCQAGKQCTICHSHQFLNSTTSTCQCITGYSLNGQGVCIKNNPCQNNKVRNTVNNTCQCGIGFIINLNNVQVCKPIVCGQNMILNSRGVCICKNSYALIGSQCIQTDGFPAKSQTYSIDLTSNNETYSRTSTYKCACPKGFKFKNSQCVPCSLLGIQCPCQPTHGLFNGVCQSCDDNQLWGCIDCQQVMLTNITVPVGTCDRCAPGYALRKHQIMFNNSYFSCQLCSSSNCTQCQFTDQKQQQVSICTTCKIYNTAIDYRGTCATCGFIPNCIHCKYNNNTGHVQSCIRCETPYVLGKNGKTCVCPSPQSSDRRCIPCHFGCLGCLGQTCLKCKPNMIKDNITGSCICPSHSLIVDLGCDNCKEPIIQRNIQGCSACNSSTSCSNCVSGYVSVYGNCQQCSRYLVGCKTCNSQTACTSCDQQSHFRLPLLTHTCTCVAGFVLVGNRCNNCSIFWMGCTQCTNLTSCSKCDTAHNFQLHNGSCQCKQHSYLFNNSKCISCSQITPACIDCSAQGQCTQCAINFDLLPNQTCVCKQGYTLIDNQCSRCSQLFEGCSLCNATVCTKCIIDYFIFDVNKSKCVEKQCFSCETCVQGKCSKCKNPRYTFLNSHGQCFCDTSGYYANYTTGVCESCTDSPLCLRCINSTRCSKCSNDMVLTDQGICDCQDRQLYYNTTTKTCETCIRFCAVCQSRVKRCKQCQEGFAYNQETNVCYMYALPEPEQTQDPQEAQESQEPIQTEQDSQPQNTDPQGGIDQP